MKQFITVTLIIILIVVFGLRVKNDWQRYRLLKQEVQQLELKNQNLSEEEQRLERLKETGSQEELLEEEARTMLGLQKVGEKVVLVLPTTENETTTTIATTTHHQVSHLIVRIQNFWYNLKAFFKP